AEPASSSADGSKTRYRHLRALHRSRLHTIMAAQDRTSNRPVVLKTFMKARMSSSLRAKLEVEVAQLRALSGVPGVVQLIQQFEDEDSVYIVLERCPGSTLIEMIANSGGRLSEAVLVPDVLIPLTLVLADLHRRGVVHRQIKPEHTLCHPSEGGGGVTLVDFSDAVNKTQRCLNNRAGALEYMAPEVLNKPTAEEVFHQVLYNGMSEEELPQYDEKADVWSLGVLTFEALTGCQPFLADTPAEMARLQRELLSQLDAAGSPWLFADCGGRGHLLSREARSFLLEALQLDPINRSSAERLLQHPLIQSYWPKYQSRQPQQQAAAAAAAGAAKPALPLPLLRPASRGGGGSGSVTAPVAAPSPPVNGMTAAAGSGGQGAAAVAVAVAAAAVAATSRTAVGGAAAGCSSVAAPAVAAQKASLLVTAPLQFPVR
ncbi:hypothetical protein VOLCADRAFT_119772, partial [Volvox carteri f. nagariensis]